MLEEVGGCRECYCLKKCGVYIEWDYMIPDETENAQQIEEEFLAEYKRLSVVKPGGKYCDNQKREIKNGPDRNEMQ